jgi:hypothetical protein
MGSLASTPSVELAEVCWPMQDLQDYDGNRNRGGVATR